MSNFKFDKDGNPIGTGSISNSDFDMNSATDSDGTKKYQVNGSGVNLLRYPFENMDRYHSHISFNIYKIDPPVVEGFGDIISKLESAFDFRRGDDDVTRGNTLQDEQLEEVNQSAIDSRLNSTGETNSSGTDLDTEDSNSKGVTAKKAKTTKIIKSDSNTNVQALPPKWTGNSIRLYLPVSFVTGDTLTYENADLGLLGAGVESLSRSGTASITTAIAQQMEMGVEGLQNLFGIGGSGNTASAAGARFLTRNTLAKSSKSRLMPESVKNAIGLVARVTVNPNTRSLFRGVAIRTFTFDFKFIPKSREEAAEVTKIVKMFRTHAYPGTDQLTLNSQDSGIDGVFTFPDMFEIVMQYDDGYVQETIGTKIKKCYLTSIRTTYNSSSMAYHQDGQPVEIDLSLTFTEEKALSRKDIEAGY